MPRYTMPTFPIQANSTLRLFYPSAVGQRGATDAAVPIACCELDEQGSELEEAS